MKRTIFMILGILSLFFYGFGQKSDTSKAWKFGSITTLSYNQTNLKYWAAGGNNSIAITGLTNVFANYEVGNIKWTNTLDLGYGLQKTGANPFRKNDDRIDFSSKFGYNIYEKKIYTAVLLSYKSQFTKGFEYKDNGDSSLISAFMAPGYLIYSLGMDYKPKDYFTIYFSPLTGKTTFVFDDSLAAVGAFGVEPGKNIRYEFGSYLKAEYKRDLGKKVSIASKITLFSNYLHKPQNIDVNFDFIFAAKITKYLSVNFANQMIYDDDILITIDPETGQQGKRLQIKNVLGLGVVINF